MIINHLNKAFLQLQRVPQLLNTNELQYINCHKLFFVFPLWMAHGSGCWMLCREREEVPQMLNLDQLSTPRVARDLIELWACLVTSDPASSSGRAPQQPAGEGGGGDAAASSRRRSSSGAAVFPPPCSRLVIVELFDPRLGAFPLLKLNFERIVTTLPVAAEWVYCDVPRVLQDAVDRRRHEPGDALTAAFERMLKPFASVMLFEPVMLMFTAPQWTPSKTINASSPPELTEMLRRAAATIELMTVIEGPDLPGIEQSVTAAAAVVAGRLQRRAGSVMEVSVSTRTPLQPSPGLTPSKAHTTAAPSPRLSSLSDVGVRLTLPRLRRDVSHAVFHVQCLWRRILQRRRIGDFIDGVFYTHAEIAERRMREHQEVERQRELAVRRQSSGATITRIARGRIGRRTAAARRMEIAHNAKLLAIMARRKTKRGTLYGCEGIPTSMEAKTRLMFKVLGVGTVTANPAGPCVIKVFRRVQPTAAVPVPSATSTVVKERSSLTADERTLLSKKHKIP